MQPCFFVYEKTGVDVKSSPENVSLQYFRQIQPSCLCGYMGKGRLAASFLYYKLNLIMTLCQDD